jgi:hypothetical protein
MAFVNEVVSDADIDKYGLPFKKGSGRYWTRDAERDMYLWGGKGGNPAFGESIYGYFHLFLEGIDLSIKLLPGDGSPDFSNTPYVIEWSKIERINPSDAGVLTRSAIVHCLKEALIIYGEDGRENEFAPYRVVKFGF